MGEGKTYSELLRSPHWQRKRLEIMQRDDFKCRFCGATEDNLHVHHVVYLGKRVPWSYDEDYLITLCDACHTDEETMKELDYFLVNMFSLSGLSRRNLFALASALRMHLNNAKFKDQKFQDLTDYLHHG